MKDWEIKQLMFMLTFYGGSHGTVVMASEGNDSRYESLM